MVLAKEAGAKRAVRLPVSGAFHSPLMKPAEEGLREALAGTSFAEPAFPVFSNVTEQESRSADDENTPPSIGTVTVFPVRSSVMVMVSGTWLPSLARMVPADG